jgi:probable phosphoglycerate mutase
MIRIILTRHGRTAWNTAEGQGPRFRGVVDLPLAGEGIDQAQITAERLTNVPLTAIYSSPLQRASHTAQIIAAPHSLPVQTLSGLGSMNYGDWTGQLHSEIARRWPDLYRQWRHDPFRVQIPGGEDPHVVRNRVLVALHESLAGRSDGDTIALVSHQVVTKTLTCILTGLPNGGFWWIRQDLCNLTSFDYDPRAETFTLVDLNDTCHLESALRHANGDGTRLVLIRHGQTAWNAGAGEERFRGRTDLPLDDIGRTQARALAERLKTEPLAALYTSPLVRAQQTIQPLAGELGLKVLPHEGLLDINYGRFQGLTHAEAIATYPEQYAAWSTSPGKVRFPGGENLAEVQVRLLALLDELATCHPGQTIALVGHQVVNKVLVCTLLGLDLNSIPRIQQNTAGLNVFQKVNGTWHTLCLNDTCHLQ